MWNPNRDCGYRSFPWDSGYLKPDVTYSIDMPEYCQLRQLEGSSKIESNDDAKPCDVFIRYWGDKHFREGKGWAKTTFPQMHGFNWTDARKEVEYRASVIKKYGRESPSQEPLPPAREVKYISITTQTIDGIPFCRADLSVPNGCVLPGHSKVDHKVVMMSDNGLDVHMQDPSPAAEKVVASLRKQ